MASPSQFQMEDQTDEDFFDKLVDDEFSVEGSHPDSRDIARELSSLSLGDVAASLEDAGDAGFGSESKEWQQNDNAQAFVTPRKDILVSEDNVQSASSVSQIAESGNSAANATEVISPASLTLKSGESKAISVKEVQWSAFSMNFGQVDKDDEGPDSDLFAEGADISAGELKNNAETNVNFAGNQEESLRTNDNSSELQNTKFLDSANVQNSDWNDTEYWENLYPGWKYDSSTGQWYQVDGYDISSIDQSDTFGTDRVNIQQSSEENVQAAGTLAGSSDTLYLQQTTQSVLETIEEDSSMTNVSNWKLSSQGSTEYPPNMVFDPQYPGWYYDTNTQQWHTLENFTETMQKSDVVYEQINQNDSTSAGFSGKVHSSYDGFEVSEAKFVEDHSNLGFAGDWKASTSIYAHQDETASAGFSGESHSVYDGIAVSESKFTQDQDNLGFTGNWNASTSIYAHQDETASAGFSGESHSVYDGIAVSESKFTQDQGNLGFTGNWNASTSIYGHQNIWQPDQVVKSGLIDGISRNQQTGNFYNSAVHAGSHAARQLGTTAFEPISNHNHSNTNGFLGSHSFNPGESMYQFNQPKVDQGLHSHLSNSYYGNHNSVNSQQQLHNVNNPYSQFSYASNEGRSSDGRPGHALVAFGFGGKLVVMKDSASLGAALDPGNLGNPRAEISILNLSEVVKDKYDGSSTVNGSGIDYFGTLCQQSFPGPLVGGNATTKDVNKWLDERIINCDSLDMNFHKGKLLKLLLSLLKISCQHYGKLRSPFGSDPSLEETDGPEMALTKLFASAKKSIAPYGEYDRLTHCMQNLPSEGNVRATAIEVQNLLVSGRRKEALQCAQEGQLWGPALVLAAQLGDKFYVDTVKKMAHYQFIPGSPLRTLCLLIAGQPAEVFSSYSSTTSMLNGVITPQQPTEIHGSGMLDDWEENLAIITANRTKDDELVTIHLGDCLWRERGEVTAAHTCYLVAEANFESYSDSTRLCLIGADHWKYPRTYASPDAIQRTELYEYSKVLGNSQFILLPFQPYKLVYAYMLAEVGKVSDSLRYCQACLKLLKNSNRAPEVEMWKSLFSSLEERLRTHQQGGYNTNLAPAKLVGKLFTSIDRSIHRMMGAPPAPLPPMPQGTVNDDKEMYSAPKVANSQSTMAMSSLISSASVETMSQWTVDSSRKPMHNRSISEPDFGRTPKQVAGSNGAQSKDPVSGGSRFGRIGSHLLQKTMGWVSRSNRQAKLGEQNKFYYDEKLKRWVEEGADPPAEEPVLAPPPKAASFQNGMPDYNMNNSLKNEYPSFSAGPDTKPSIPLENNSGIPPIPPSQNQFSARGRVGVRSRYVDTFNKGGAASTGSSQSPAVPSVKPPPMIGAKFFVPTTPATLDEQRTDATGESSQEGSNQEEPSTSVLGDPSFLLPSSSSPSIPRFPSMDNITPIGNKASGEASRSGNGPLSHTRAASWGGTYTDAFDARMSEMTTPNDGRHKISSFLPNTTTHTGLSSSSSLPHNGGTLGDDLHEVEL